VATLELKSLDRFWHQ